MTKNSDLKSGWFKLANPDITGWSSIWEKNWSQMNRLRESTFCFFVVLERHHIPQQIITLFPFGAFCGAGSIGNHFGHPPEFKLASTCQWTCKKIFKKDIVFHDYTVLINMHPILNAPIIQQVCKMWGLTATDGHWQRHNEALLTSIY